MGPRHREMVPDPATAGRSWCATPTPASTWPPRATATSSSWSGVWAIDKLREQPPTIEPLWLVVSGALYLAGMLRPCCSGGGCCGCSGRR